MDWLAKRIDCIELVCKRFLEFYNFSHRNFIYDDVDVNVDVYKLLGVDVPIPKIWDGDTTRACAVLNNGDCFIAALAIGEALRVQGYRPRYHSNGGHYFVSFKHYEEPHDVFPVYFDTIFPRGKRNIDEMLRHPNPALYRLAEGDAQWLVERALEDAIDIAFIEQFVRFFTPVYKFPYAIPPGVGTEQWFYKEKGVE